MSKGDGAKERVVEALRQAFGDKFLGVQDKKCYIQSEEDGMPVQVAVTLTCPKTPVEFDGAVSATSKVTGGVLDFSDTPEVKKLEVEVSEQEQKNIADLLKKLGL